MPELVKPDSKERLNKYLDSHGIKRKYLAEKLGMSESNISYYLHGNGKLTLDLLFKISLVIGISPRVFLSKNYKKMVERECKQ